jgi:hypothetical protein
MPQISDEALINELQRLADELECRPGTRDMDNHGEFSSKTYSDRFDSWNKSLVVAGLENSIPRNAVISDNALVNELQRVATARDTS